MLADIQTLLFGAQSVPTEKPEIGQSFSGLLQQNLDQKQQIEPEIGPQVGSQAVDFKIVSEKFSEIDPIPVLPPQAQAVSQWSEAVDEESVTSGVVSDVIAGIPPVFVEIGDSDTRIVNSVTSSTDPGIRAIGEPLPGSGNELPLDSMPVIAGVPLVPLVPLVPVVPVAKRGLLIPATSESIPIAKSPSRDNIDMRVKFALQQQSKRLPPTVQAQVPAVQVATPTRALPDEFVTAVNLAVAPDKSGAPVDTAVNPIVQLPPGKSAIQTEVGVLADIRPSVSSGINLQSGLNKTGSESTGAHLKINLLTPVTPVPARQAEAVLVQEQIKLERMSDWTGILPRQLQPGISLPREPSQQLPIETQSMELQAVKSVSLATPVPRPILPIAINKPVAPDPTLPLQASVPADEAAVKPAFPELPVIAKTREMAALAAFESSQLEQPQFELTRTAIQSQGQQAGIANNAITAVPLVAGPQNSGFALPTQPHADALILARNAGSTEWGNGIGERVNWMINQKLNSATIRLDPPALGRLDVQIRLADDVTTITIQTQLAQTRDLVEASAHRLRDFLQENGYQNVNVDVSYRQEQHNRSQQSTASESGSPDDSEQGHEPDSEDKQPNQFFSGDGLVDTFA